jgi:D-arginine dehydrogenase
VSRRGFPSDVDLVVVGAGFAGASVAAALAKSGIRRGLILEQERQAGTHASGRNAAMARQLEPDPSLCKLAIDGVRRLRDRRVAGCSVFHERGALYLIHERVDRVSEWLTELCRQFVPFELLRAHEARQRFPLLNGLDFGYACFCPTDGVVDIHALLASLLTEARAGGFDVVTDCRVEQLLLEGSVVCGLQTRHGGVQTQIVIDAMGAWAGDLGRLSAPLPLTPFRRHLFFGTRPGSLPCDAPLVWDLDVGYYLRPDGGGALLCPCDETRHAPGIPAVDFMAAELLAEKLLKHAPGLADVAIQRSWACLRTFAPDRRPVIGWDPDISGLFHVSGLGGFGVTTSLAIGEIASNLIRNAPVDWIDVRSFSPRREVLKAKPSPTVDF